MKKDWTKEEIYAVQIEKRYPIERMLLDMYSKIGMDIPSNHDSIVDYCFEDVCDTADPENWHSGDVVIAFRRWIEEQGNNL